MRLIPLFIAIVAAFVAFYVIYVFTGSDAPVTERQVIVEKPVEVIRPEPTKQILIASRYIAPGNIIDSTMLDRQDWPERLIVDQFLVADSPQANIIGMVARSPFQPREPLALSKLAKQGDPSFIAATLPNGQRMVTIATDGINGVAGFVYPGDKVDILLTHNVEVPSADPKATRGQTKQEQISEPLLVNVPVIAVDQRASTDAAEKLQLPSSVSLQVSPDDAQKLRLSEKRGSLSLALRSLKDKDESLVTPTTRFDITHFYTQDEAAPGDNPMMAAAMPNQAGVSIMVTRGVKSETVELDAPAKPMDGANGGTDSTAPSKGKQGAAATQPTNTPPASAQPASARPAPTQPAAQPAASQPADGAAVRGQNAPAPANGSQTNDGSANGGSANGSSANGSSANGSPTTTDTSSAQPPAAPAAAPMQPQP